MPGVPVHVVHRGNRRGNVFVDDSDREAYLDCLSECAERQSLDLWAYCLISNHVHLIAMPKSKEALARTIGRAHRRHAVRINRRLGWSGHLWENRYYSTVLDERHLWWAVRYVERNPVRAGLVTRAEEFRWSSARTHCGLAHDARLACDRPFPGAMERWGEWLDLESDDPAALAIVRANSRSGHPTGSPDFIGRLETDLGRCLERRNRGRPRAEKEGQVGID